MKKVFTIFVANDELFKSPAVYLYSKEHDVSLSVGHHRVVDLPLPHNLLNQYQEIYLVYNPNLLEINSADLIVKGTLHCAITYITITMVAREIGSTSLEIATKNTPLPTTQKTYLSNHFQHQHINHLSTRH